jgi:UDP-N-acetylmuramyl pentapeptide phosphotransferase/UDP-N-acetylglucosamine-1-phosphate transferase
MADVPVLSIDGLVAGLAVAAFVAACIVAWWAYCRR